MPRMHTEPRTRHATASVRLDSRHQVIGSRKFSHLSKLAGAGYPELGGLGLPHRSNCFHLHAHLVCLARLAGRSRRRRFLLGRIAASRCSRHSGWTSALAIGYKGRPSFAEAVLSVRCAGAAWTKGALVAESSRSSVGSLGTAPTALALSAAQVTRAPRVPPRPTPFGACALPPLPPRCFERWRQPLWRSCGRLRHTLVTERVLGPEPRPRCDPMPQRCPAMGSHECSYHELHAERQARDLRVAAGVQLPSGFRAP